MLIYSLLYVHIHHALRVQIVYQVNIRIENRKLRGRINILYWTKKKIPRPPLAQIWVYHYNNSNSNGNIIYGNQNYRNSNGQNIYYIFLGVLYHNLK